MKVAVISLASTYGKTCLIAVLAGVYSRSQRRDAVILSTGDATDNIDIIDCQVRNDDVANPYVFKSMVEAAENNDKDLLNYGIRQGAESVYIFNTLGNAMQQGEKEEFFMSAMGKLPADLMLVEIKGDPMSEFNQQVLYECDCCLVLVEQSTNSIKKMSETKAALESARDGLSANAAFVVSMYNPDVCSDKKFSQVSGIKVGSMFKFNYSPAIAKLALNGELDRIAYDIVIGDFNVVNLRMQMLEIMQYIFDTESRKIIRGIDRWYR